MSDQLKCRTAGTAALREDALASSRVRPANVRKPCGWQSRRATLEASRTHELVRKGIEVAVGIRTPGIQVVGRRMSLVVASQCTSLGPNLILEGLDDVAQDLHQVLTDARIGQCVGAGPDNVNLTRRGLITGAPRLAEIEEAIRWAWKEAATERATLILAWMGHGKTISIKGKDTLHLLAGDSLEKTIPGLDLSALIDAELRGCNATPAGFIVLIDACSSGQLALDVLHDWRGQVSRGIRFEFLAATAGEDAYDACFSRTVAKTLRMGIRSLEARTLTPQDLVGTIQAECLSQTPLRTGIDSSLRLGAEPSLWLGCNVVVTEAPWSDQPETRAMLAEFTKDFVETEALAEVRENFALTTASCLAVTALAGQGKSTILAQLASSQDEGLHAIVFVRDAMTPTRLAATIVGQLERNEAYLKARERFMKRTPELARSTMSLFRRELLGPLSQLFGNVLRLAIDGFDRLSVSARHTLEPLFQLPEVKVLVSTDLDAQLPAGADRIELKQASAAELEQYFMRQGVSNASLPAVVVKAQGNWLIASLLAKSHRKAQLGTSGHDVVQAGLDEILSRWGEPESIDRKVLSILAANGPGPEMPLRLLEEATRKMFKWAGNGSLEESLRNLSGLIVRSNIRFADEHIGVFHSLVAIHAATPEAVEMIDHAVEAIVPAAPAPEDACWQYSQRHKIRRPLATSATRGRWSLDAGLSVADRHEELELLQEWFDRVVSRAEPSLWSFQALARIAQRAYALGDFSTAIRLIEVAMLRHLMLLGLDHPEFLRARLNVAHWTGLAGDPRRALALLKSLLPLGQKQLGPDHKDVLRTRNNIAYWTGECGDARDALDLFVSLLSDQKRVLGANHHDTLLSRNSIACLTGENGDCNGGLRQLEALLPDLVRELGEDHPHVLSTRGNIAALTGECGAHQRGLELYETLLKDQSRILGANHPSSLYSLSNFVGLLALNGKPQEALELGEKLLPVMQRVLGETHPNSLRMRNSAAALAADCGNARLALKHLRTLLPSLRKALGRNHADVLRCRLNIALCIGNTGCARRALRMTQSLLPTLQHLLGREHRLVLVARRNIGAWTMECGDATEALQLLERLLADERQLLGDEHPDVFSTRHQIASCAGERGDIRDAVGQFENLLLERVRALGENHPEVLATRCALAKWIGKCGDSWTARDLLQQVLPLRRSLLGEEHPDVLKTCCNLANLTAECGDTAQVLSQLEALLLVQQRIQGELHPDVLETRRHQARWTAQCGDTKRAIELACILLPVQEQVLGDEHPDVLDTRNGLACWTAEGGDAAGALAMLKDLLPVQQRVLGASHPSALKTQADIARCEGR